VKRGLLLKRIAAAGAVFVRHGASHDLYRNTRNGAIESVPRHPDIEENLAWKIIRNLSK
jgi:predicted RNA binding protein YcfA (HicA-like mRNA interferase family)